MAARSAVRSSMSTWWANPNHINRAKGATLKHKKDPAREESPVDEQVLFYLVKNLKNLGFVISLNLEISQDKHAKAQKIDLFADE